MIFPFSFPLLTIFLSGYSNFFPNDVWISLRELSFISIVGEM